MPSAQFFFFPESLPAVTGGTAKFFFLPVCPTGGCLQWAVARPTQAHASLTSDGTLNSAIASYDCKTLVYYINNAITPGDRLTYTLEKQ